MNGEVIYESNEPHGEALIVLDDDQRCESSCIHHVFFNRPLTEPEIRAFRNHVKRFKGLST